MVYWREISSSGSNGGGRVGGWSFFRQVFLKNVPFTEIIRMNLVVSTKGSSLKKVIVGGLRNVGFLNYIHYLDSSNL